MKKCWSMSNKGYKENYIKKNLSKMKIKIILPYSTYIFSLDIFHKSEKILCHVEEPIDGNRIQYEFKSQKHAWMCLKDKIKEAKLPIYLQICISAWHRQ